MHLSQAEIEKAIAWLHANHNQITHIRSRNMFGAYMFVAYNRNQIVPIIDSQPMMVDDANDSQIHDAIVSLNISLENPIH